MQDNEILCWDLRNYGSILHIVKRNASSNQRYYFDTSSDFTALATGDDSGILRFYDLNSSPPGEDKVLTCTAQFQAHDNCVNGVGCVLYLLA